jgi:hypothetical protein
VAGAKSSAAPDDALQYYKKSTAGAAFTGRPFLFFFVRDASGQGKHLIALMFRQFRRHRRALIRPPGHKLKITCVFPEWLDLIRRLSPAMTAERKFINLFKAFLLAETSG